MFDTDLDPAQHSSSSCKKARVEDSTDGKTKYLYMCSSGSKSFGGEFLLVVDPRSRGTAPSHR